MCTVGQRLFLTVYQILVLWNSFQPRISILVPSWAEKGVLVSCHSLNNLKASPSIHQLSATSDGLQGRRIEYRLARRAVARHMRHDLGKETVKKIWFHTIKKKPVYVTLKRSLLCHTTCIHFCSRRISFEWLFTPTLAFTIWLSPLFSTLLIIRCLPAVQHIRHFLHLFACFPVFVPDSLFTSIVDK